MFKSIRSTARRLRSNNKTNAATSKHADHKHNVVTPDLLGLPGELRNLIYELVASETKLTLPAFRDRKKIKHPPGLLLVCKTTANEYRAFLLQHASITARVYEYNFNSIRSVLSRLDDDTLATLLQNVHLKIEIFIAASPSQTQIEGLKQWLHFRDQPTEPTYLIEFAYILRFLPNFRPPRPLIRYRNGYHMKLDLLNAHIGVFKTLADEGQEEGGAAADGTIDQAQIAEINSIINDAESLREVYEELANRNAQDQSSRNGQA